MADRPYLAFVRLLLIVALLIAAMGFTPPAAAHMDADAGHDHAAMEHRGHQHGDNGNTVTDHAAVHVCPGCALPDQPLVADPAPAPAKVPSRPADPASLGSFNANPIPPPPKAA